MHFSVVMPTYRRGRQICAALESVLAQSDQDYELVVVDDHSEPPTMELVPELCGRENVHYIYLESNLGVSAARNVALREARGEYVAFIDDDDVFMPDKLARLRTAFEATEADVVYHAMMINLVKEGVRYRNNPFPSPFSLDDLLTKNLLGGPTMVAARRDALLSVGGFDETLPALEDYELWIRLFRAGYRFQFLDHCLAEYRRRTDTNSKSHRVDLDIVAWERLHEKHADAYGAFNQALWKEHRQKIELFRAYRSLLAYDRKSAASYLMRAFSERPSFVSGSLVIAAVLALISPRYTLVLQGLLKRSRLLASLYVPLRTLGSRRVPG